MRDNDAEQVEPALTPEEWAQLECLDPLGEGAAIRDHGLFVVVAGAGCVQVDVPNPAGLAALALHGQPFGFTHEDVGLVLHARGFLKREGYDDDPDYRALKSLADRIAALLPPE